MLVQHIKSLRKSTVLRKPMGMVAKQAVQLYCDPQWTDSVDSAVFAARFAVQS